MDDEMVIDPLDIEIHAAVHNYKNPFNGKKGAVGMAPVVGMNPSTLQNKANPREEFAGLEVKEFRKVMQAANDFSALKQLNMGCGFVAIPIPQVEYPADMDLVNAHLELIGELGEAAEEMKKSLNDKVLKHSELKSVEKEFYDVVEKVHSLLGVLRGMAEPETGATVTNINSVKA